MDDVIIIGAGPARNNAARRLAQFGHSVTVIERGERIGDKLCTGIVGRECVQRYPVDSALVHGQAHCARFVIPSGENLDLVREEPQAFILDRVGYVDSFAKDAKEAGARYLMSHRVAAVWRDNGTIKVGLAPQSTSSILEARAVVVASGFGTSLVQGLGMKMEKDFVTGIQSVVIAPSLNRVHVYFGRDVAPGFFAWLVPTSGGRALVGLLSRRHAQHYMERLLARLKDEDKVAGVIKGPHQWGIPLKPLPRTFGDRVVVVGDAAGQVKPTTGGGIYYSLLAGELAAETLHQGFAKNDLSSSFLSLYESRWKALMHREMEVGFSARRLFEHLKDKQMEQIMRMVKERSLHIEMLDSPELSFDWHSRFILKTLAHPVFGLFLLRLSPALGALMLRIKGV